MSQSRKRPRNGHVVLPLKLPFKHTPPAGVKTSSDPTEASLRDLISKIDQLSTRISQIQSLIDEGEAAKVVNVTRMHSRGLAGEQATIFHSYIREHARVVLGLQSLRGKVSWPVVDHVNGDSDIDGPDIERLTIDWDEPGTTAWTRRVGVLFEARFMAQYRMGAFPRLLESPEPGKIAQSFIEYVVRLKKTSRDTKADQKRRVARKRTRRQRLFNLRVRCLQNLRLSGSALNVMQLLGVDGMSSEESEGAIGGQDRTYRVKFLPWRAGYLTDWLRTLDALSVAKPESVRSRQYKRRARMSSNLISSRSPPTLLPVSFYQPEWLNRQTQAKRIALQVSRDHCELPSIATLCS